MSWLYPLIFAFLAAVVIKQLHQKASQCTQKLNSFISNHKSSKSLLLVIAHPDDESMFFIPMIENLKKFYKINIMCFSNGNSDGLGKIREKELKSVANFLEIQNITIIDNGYLKDGMKAYSTVSNGVKKKNDIFSYFLFIFL